MVVVVRKANSSKCFQSRPMVREARRRRMRVRIVTRREVEEVEEVDGESVYGGGGELGVKTLSM